MDDAREFAEHLRTVHFALILTAFALLAGSLLTKGADAERALAQIREIRELAQRWKLDWFDIGAAEAVRNERKHAPFPLEWWIDEKVDGRMLLQLDSEFWVTLGPEAIKLAIPEFEVIESDGSEWAGDTERIRPRSQVPRNLSEFRVFWDSIADLRILRPKIPDEALLWWRRRLEDPEVEALEQEHPNAPPGLFRSTTSSLERAGLFPPDHFSLSDLKKASHKDASKASKVFKLELLYWPAKKENAAYKAVDGLFAWILEESELRSIRSAIRTADKPGLGYLSWEGENGEAIFIPIEYEQTIFNGQPAFQRSHGTHFDYGKFAEAFPELESLTKNFQDLPYDRLVLILENEAKRATDRIELFGAKIPANALALWGVPILILLQSYFLLHVAMFCRLLPIWGELPKVAWIGLYSTKASRIATLSSSVLLPFAIVILLGLQGSSHPWWQWTVSVAGTLASSLLGFLTMISLSQLNQALAGRVK